MSDVEEPAVVPEGTDAPKVQEKPAETKSQGEPEWLPKRLEQAKSSAQSELLKTLGFASAEDVKAQLEELAKFKESQLTEQERVAKRLAELEPQAQRTVQLEETLGQYAARELSTLTESQSEAVKEIAGEDPSLVLRTIERLKPTWASAEPAKPPEAPPAKTTAQASGPPDTGHQSPVDHAAEYRRLKTTNPFAAASYLRTHRSEIFANNQ